MTGQLPDLQLSALIDKLLSELHTIALTTPCVQILHVYVMGNHQKA